jgi:integrase
MAIVDGMPTLTVGSGKGHGDGMAAEWTVDATKILTRLEVATVLLDLRRRGLRSVNGRMNKALFRLTCCCGLRASEAAGLRLRDVVIGMLRPHLRVPKAVAKGRRGRRIPLWWDAMTLIDLTGWRDERIRQGAGPGDWFLCTQKAGQHGHKLDRRHIRSRFLTGCQILGPDRVKHLTVHHARHSFVSHALAGGRSLAEVRDAAGHRNIATTSIYTHIAVEDDGLVGDLFKFDGPAVAKNPETRDAETPENLIGIGETCTTMPPRTQ